MRDQHAIEGAVVMWRETSRMLRVREGDGKFVDAARLHAVLDAIAKLTGLITFGSPLDKIALFFREHTKAHEYIRRQIKSHLHSFKAKPLDDKNDELILADPIKHNLDDIVWVNYYSKSDPISGHLDFYKIAEEDNVLLNLPEFWGVAHVGYWTHQPFYKDIVARFL